MADGKNYSWVGILLGGTLGAVIAALGSYFVEYKKETVETNKFMFDSIESIHKRCEIMADWVDGVVAFDSSVGRYSPLDRKLPYDIEHLTNVLALDAFDKVHSFSITAWRFYRQVVLLPPKSHISDTVAFTYDEDTTVYYTTLEIFVREIDDRFYRAKYALERVASKYTGVGLTNSEIEQRREDEYHIPVQPVLSCKLFPK
jgi:hypothetical protein